MISCPNHAISVHLAADLPTPFQSRLSDERTTCLSHVSLFVSHSFKRPNQLMKKQTKTQTGVYCTLSFREIVLCFLSFSVIKEGSEPHIISLDVVQWLPPAIIICQSQEIGGFSDFFLSRGVFFSTRWRKYFVCSFIFWSYLSISHVLLIAL